MGSFHAQDLRVIFFVALVTLGVFFFADNAFAQGSGPQVSIQLERSPVVVGEPFWASVTVEGLAGRVMVSLPPGSPFEVLRRGGTSSFSFSFGGGSQRSQQTVRLQLRATSPGRQTLGPLVVTVGGQQYRAGTANVEVLAGSGGGNTSSLPPSTLSGTKVPQPGGNQPTTPRQQATKGSSIPEQVAVEELDGAVYDNEMFLRTVVEPRTAVVGQQVVMNVYLYRRIRIDEWTLSREPTTEGFWVEDFGRDQQELRQFVGQTMFVVHQVKRVALFPLKAGTLTIGAPQVEARSGFAFFSRRASTIVREGVPVEVIVRNLPAEGRPEGFEDENIGRFAIKSQVDTPRAKVGEPVTLTVTVNGRGNLRKVKVPTLGEIEGARMYEPRVNDAVAAQNGQLVGERRWEYLIMPQKEGRLELPSVELDFFDPEAKQYRRVRSKTVIVEVSGRAAPESRRDTLEAIDDLPEIEGETTGPEMGPLHLIRRQAALTSDTTPLYAAWWFIALLFLAPAGFIALVVVQGVRHHRITNRDVVRSRRAAQVAQRALETIEGGDTEEGIAKVMKIVNEFFVDRLGRSAVGLTMEELENFVVELGAAEGVATRVVELVERCEHARFAGGGEEAGAVAKEIAREAKELVVALDEMPSSERGTA